MEYAVAENQENLTNLEDQPLVTLILLTYNQEQFVEAAIQGALSQTYAPLEIIISDDCSSDNTYDIICDVVQKSCRPERPHILRNKTNLGLIPHLNHLIHFVNGEIVILAAGDDISYPLRCEKIVDAFQKNPYIYALHTIYDIIDEKGAKVKTKKRPSKNYLLSDLDLLYNGGGLGLGATYAYRKKCFTWPKVLPDNLVNEDRILPWRAHLLGGVLFLNEVLLSYRLTPHGLSRNAALPRWPARKNKEHIKNLIIETVLAYKLGALRKADLDLYKHLLLRLFSHMDMLDVMRARGGFLGHFLANCSRALFLGKYWLFRRIR